jgi:hypothetical protein
MVNIQLKNNSKNEKKIKRQLIDMITKYDPPIFYKIIVIDENAKYPHSHPDVTLDTKFNDKWKLLEVFIHEQFHHFEEQNVNNERNKDYYDYIDKHYKCTGYAFDKVKGYSVLENFAQHLVVCFNTIKIMKKSDQEKEIIEKEGIQKEGI